MSIADLVAQAEAAAPYHPDGRIKSMWEHFRSSKAARHPLKFEDVEALLLQSGYKGPTPIEYTKTGKPSVLMYSKADDAPGTEKRKSFVAVSELGSKRGTYVVKAECPDPIAFQSRLKSFSAYAGKYNLAEMVCSAGGAGVGMLTGLVILKAAGGFDANINNGIVAELVTKVGPLAVFGFIGMSVGGAVGGILYGRFSYEKTFGDEKPVWGIDAIKSVIDAMKAQKQVSTVTRYR